MKKFEIPQKLKNHYIKTGILAIGEYHGIKENYGFYQELLNSLPDMPNLAVEMKDIERKEFEKFLAGQQIDTKNLHDDGRLSIEYFNFLKNYIKNNPTRKIIYFDETDTDKNRLLKKSISRDKLMAEYFLGRYEKPIVIIAGNIHTQKNIISVNNKQIIPMGYYIKEKIGDYPTINVIPLCGSIYNNGIKELKLITNKNANQFYEKEKGEFVFYLEKATPITPFIK